MKIAHIVIACICAIAFWVEQLSGYPDHIVNVADSLRGAFCLAAAAYVASLAPVEAVIKSFGTSQQKAILIALLTGLAWFVLGIVADFIASDGISGHKPSIGLFLYGLFIWVPSLIVFAISVFILPLIVGFTVIYILPFTAMGIIALMTSTSTLQIAREHAGNKLPSDEIEKRLSEAMRGDLANDAEVTALLVQLPMLSRIFHTFRYNVKQHKYRGMWKMLQAQEETIREQTRTAKAAHSLERTKRGDH